MSVEEKSLFDHERGVWREEFKSLMFNRLKFLEKKRTLQKNKLEIIEGKIPENPIIIDEVLPSSNIAQTSSTATSFSSSDSSNQIVFPSSINQIPQVIENNIIDLTSLDDSDLFSNVKTNTLIDEKRSKYSLSSTSFSSLPVYENNIYSFEKDYNLLKNSDFLPINSNSFSHNQFSTSTSNTLGFFIFIENFDFTFFSCSPQTQKIPRNRAFFNFHFYY
jgi:hypothetical protein